MTYEYVCEACGHQWEAEQSIKDRPLKKCVSCAKDKAKRLISGGTGFLLKGGGWYADLYSSANAKPAASAEKSETKPAASESGSKDAKPAASSDGSSSNGSSGSSSTPSSTATASAKAS